jgi:hypothetical protein
VARSGGTGLLYTKPWTTSQPIGEGRVAGAEVVDGHPDAHGVELPEHPAGGLGGAVCRQVGQLVQGPDEPAAEQDREDQGRPEQTRQDGETPNVALVEGRLERHDRHLDDEAPRHLRRNEAVLHIE